MYWSGGKHLKTCTKKHFSHGVRPLNIVAVDVDMVLVFQSILLIFCKNLTNHYHHKLAF